MGSPAMAMGSGFRLLAGRGSRIACCSPDPVRSITGLDLQKIFRGDLSRRCHQLSGVHPRDQAESVP